MASVNEFSARYSEMPDDFYVPETFRTQSKINHQASEGNLDDETNQKLSETTQAYTEDTYKLYKFMLEKGVSREMARIVLPVSTYTQFVWKIDLHNLLKFLRLRMDPTAQEEIRVYADVIWDIVKIWVPMTAKAFEEFQLQSMTFSGKETKLLRQLMRQVPQQVIQNLVDESGLKKRSKEKFLSL
jgi:thymidylate synthase (FAD)